MRKRFAGVWLLCCSLLLSGCWDRVEIEERGFVVGVAIDQPEDPEAEKGRYRLTQQIVVPGKLGSKAGQGGGGGGGEGAYLNITEAGESMFGIVRDTAAQTSRSPYYEHIQVMILSSDVVREEGALGKVIDHFIRHPEMRRATKVVIAEGEAKQTLELQPKNERLPALYLDSISMNNFKNARMLPVSKIGDLHEYLLGGQSFTIQRIKAEKNEVKVIGNAVFNTPKRQMVGFLEGDETEGLNFLTGEVQGGILKLKYKGEPLIFDMMKASHKIEVQAKGPEEIVFDINIEVEGAIGESFSSVDFVSSEVLSKSEELIAKEIERICRKTVETLQEDLRTDAMRLGSELRIADYDLWERIKDDWDSGKNYFSQSKINVTAKANVRSTGIINKTYSEEE